MKNKCSNCKLSVVGEWHHCPKTPLSVKREIEKRFRVLVRRDMLKVSVKGKVLTLTGRIEAVQAMDRFVMEKYVPTACKFALRAHFKKDAIYTYKFE